MSKSLDGRLALVTGAGSGIGRATALKLAAEGARVALLSRSADEVRALADEMCGGKPLELVADVADAEAMEHAFAQVQSEFNGLDIVVANAGVNGVWAPLEQIKIEEWDETQAIKVRGTFLTLRLALPQLKARRGSAIVVASVNGTRIFSNTGATAYSCSKATQVAMAKMLAVEFGPFGVRINVICPGAINTNIGKNTKARHIDEVKIPVHFPEGAIPPYQGQTGRSRRRGRAHLVSGFGPLASHHGHGNLHRRRTVAVTGVICFSFPYQPT